MNTTQTLTNTAFSAGSPSTTTDTDIVIVVETLNETFENYGLVAEKVLEPNPDIILHPAWILAVVSQILWTIVTRMNEIWYVTITGSLAGLEVVFMQAGTLICLPFSPELA